MEIYLDVLILENIVMNYLILWTSGKLSKMRTTNLRLFMGALLGALYAAFLIIRPDISSTISEKYNDTIYNACYKMFF
jgi:stage II sporulation protein GA (sporulation sigma-E factor processing peptidase)